MGFFAFFPLEPGYVPDEWPSNKHNIPALLQRNYIPSSAHAVMTTKETASVSFRANPKVSKVAKCPKIRTSRDYGRPIAEAAKGQLPLPVSVLLGPSQNTEGKGYAWSEHKLLCAPSYPPDLCFSA